MTGPGNGRYVAVEGREGGLTQVWIMDASTVNGPDPDTLRKLIFKDDLYVACYLGFLSICICSFIIGEAQCDDVYVSSGLFYITRSPCFCIRRSFALIVIAVLYSRRHAHVSRPRLPLTSLLQL